MEERTLQEVEKELAELRNDVDKLIHKGVIVRCDRCGSIDEGHNTGDELVCHPCMYPQEGGRRGTHPALRERQRTAGQERWVPQLSLS